MIPKTILIGLDGATFTILDSLIERGVMPFLREFIAGGVRAPLRTVVPPLTPPAWTSLMTGKRPGAHGVFDFFQKEAPESRYFRLAVSQDIGCDTIWSLANAHGRRVSVLNFPLMFPPPALDGCVVPGGWMPWRQLRLGCHPPGLFDCLKALPSFNARELAMDMAAEATALEGCATEEYADWIALHTRRERRWGDIARFLMQNEPADLTAVLFDGVDKLQHLCWRLLDPECRAAAPSSWEREVADLCVGYFRQLDGLIAEIVGLARADATIVLASDHGFGPSRDVFYVNSWLEQQGYLAWACDGEAPQGDELRVGIGRITRHVNDLDWGRTVAYAATPSSQGIHIVQRGPDTPGGVSPEAYDRVRGELVEGLRRLRHPRTGRPVIAEVWTREEAFDDPHQDLGPDLTILLEDNGVVSILRSDTVLRHRPAPVGTHHPVGVLMARGPGMRAGAVLDECSILDVPIMILHSLDVPIPGDLPGRLLVEAFEPEALHRRPPRMDASSPPPPAPGGVTAPDTPELAYDAEEEAVLMERLRALGYVE